MSTSDCSYAEPFALQVLGDSMEPEFPDKCVIVVAPTDACYNGAYVVIEVDGERWFRQYVEDADGNKRLVAANPDYPEIPLAGTQFTIQGAVTRFPSLSRHRPTFQLLLPGVSGSVLLSAPPK